MPVEIRELIIKALIGKKKKLKLEGVSVEVSKEQFDEIVSLCAAKVLEKIKEDE